MGFEISESASQLRKVLSSLEYNITEYILSPTQIGVPNSRPRYYCVAVRSSISECGESKTREVIDYNPPHAMDTIQPLSAYLDCNINEVSLSI